MKTISHSYPGLTRSNSGILLKFQDFINLTMIKLTGKDPIGKIKALQVSASSWENSNFIKQWHMTYSVLESIVAEHNYGILIFDELDQV